MQFQPSECAKLCMMMALAHWLALYRDRTTSFWWGFVMPGVIFGIPLALILFEKDMAPPWPWPWPPSASCSWQARVKSTWAPP